MFGKDKKQDRPVGAAAKQARARKLKAMGYFDGGLGAASHEASPHERLYSTLFILAMSMVLAWLLTDGPIAAGRLNVTGVPLLDDIVLSPTPPTLVGDALFDLILIVVIRGFLLLGVAGFLPIVSWLWAELIDRPLMSAYRTVWGVTLALGIGALLIKPFFTLIFSNFGMLTGG